MKKEYILLLVCMLFFGSFSYSQTKNKKLEEFVVDLSSTNVHLRGKLLLMGQYKNDLSTLTFTRYVELLKNNESNSNKGIAALIQKADKHAFATKKNSFLIAIYSKELNAVLYDDANTAFTDYILQLKPNQVIPDLNKLISNKGFNLVQN